MTITKEKLIEELNKDLASELGAIIQYLTYAAKCSGPYRPQLSSFFSSEVEDEKLHALYLANKITALGGEPTTVPAPVKAASSNKEMLQNVLEAETEAIKSYQERAKQAEEYGDKGLALHMEDMVKDESEHAEETHRLLTGWTEC